MKLLVCGGAGFIGSAFVRARVAAGDDVRVLDKLTYAGHLANLADVRARIEFTRGDIADPACVGAAVDGGLDAVVNLAAESHVDRSLDEPAPFVRTNVTGVQVLLDAVRAAGVPRFVQVSTDEVYGAAPAGVRFDARAPLRPTNPYAATKAAADLMARAYHRSFGVPAIVTRCTNNYGPYQFPEKLIPLAIARALAGQPIPLYGDGLHERDWLHVDDHVAALSAVLERGRPGAVYHVAADHPRTNRALLEQLLGLLGAAPALITAVEDRRSHDRRYALDDRRTRAELGWAPAVPFAEGLAATVAWYRSHGRWIDEVSAGEEG